LEAFPPAIRRRCRISARRCKLTDPSAVLRERLERRRDQRTFQSGRRGNHRGAVPNLKLKWPRTSQRRVDVQQPTVAADAFFGADTGYVYALDAKSGCVAWASRRVRVRNAPSVGPVKATLARRMRCTSATCAATSTRSRRRQGALDRQRRPASARRGHRLPHLHKGVSTSPWPRARKPRAAVRLPLLTFRAASSRSTRTRGSSWKTFIIGEEPKPTKKNSRGVHCTRRPAAASGPRPPVDEARARSTSVPATRTAGRLRDNDRRGMALDLATGKPRGPAAHAGRRVARRL